MIEPRVLTGFFSNHSEENVKSYLPKALLHTVISELCSEKKLCSVNLCASKGGFKTRSDLLYSLLFDCSFVSSVSLASSLAVYWVENYAILRFYEYADFTAKQNRNCFLFVLLRNFASLFFTTLQLLMRIYWESLKCQREGHIRRGMIDMWRFRMT